MSSNSSLCSHDNPDYVEDVRLSEYDRLSGCTIPSHASAGPVLESCCRALGDDFQLTFQHWFQLVPETRDDDVPCYTTCTANVSEVYYADQQNITECVDINARREDVDIEGDVFRCAGPNMRTRDSLAIRQAGLESFSWGLGFMALVACLLNL